MKSNQYSTTALLIAKSHVFLSSDPEYQHLVSPEALSWSLRFIEAATGEEHFNRKCEKKSFRWFINTYEKLICPGIIRHYLHRKQYIERQAQQILQQGQTNRVVILAGGFDSLALRLALKYPEVEFIELDHPATQQVKVAAVGQDQPENMQFFSVDFTEKKLTDVLESDDTTGTLFIAEGLLMYLAEQEVHELLQALQTISPTCRSLIFTYLPAGGQSETFFTKLWLSFKQERLNWTINPEEIQELTGSAFKHLVSNELVSPRPVKNHLLRETVCVVTA